MDEMRAMLDSLMGRDRNVCGKEKRGDYSFKDDEVCKFYLLDYCPHELFPNTRSDLGPCPHAHRADLKEAFEKDENHEYYKALYEQEFMKFLKRLVDQMEARIKRVQQRIDANNANTELDKDTSEKIQAVNTQISELLKKQDEAGAKGDMDVAEKLNEEVALLQREVQRLKNPHADIATIRESQLRVCAVCGALQSAGDALCRYESHASGKQHRGFERIRSSLAKLIETESTREAYLQKHSMNSGSSYHHHRAASRARSTDRRPGAADRPGVGSAPPAGDMGARKGGSSGGGRSGGGSGSSTTIRGSAPAGSRSSGGMGGGDNGGGRYYSSRGESAGVGERNSRGSSSSQRGSRDVVGAAAARNPAGEDEYRKSSYNSRSREEAMMESEERNRSSSSRQYNNGHRTKDYNRGARGSSGEYSGSYPYGGRMSNSSSSSSYETGGELRYSNRGSIKNNVGGSSSSSRGGGGGCGRSYGEEGGQHGYEYYPPPRKSSISAGSSWNPRRGAGSSLSGYGDEMDRVAGGGGGGGAPRSGSHSRYSHDRPGAGGWICGGSEGYEQQQAQHHHAGSRGYYNYYEDRERRHNHEAGSSRERGRSFTRHPQEGADDGGEAADSFEGRLCSSSSSSSRGARERNGSPFDAERRGDSGFARRRREASSSCGRRDEADMAYRESKRYRRTAAGAQSGDDESDAAAKDRSSSHVRGDGRSKSSRERDGGEEERSSSKFERRRSRSGTQKRRSSSSTRRDDRRSSNIASTSDSSTSTPGEAGKGACVATTADSHQEKKDTNCVVEESDKKNSCKVAVHGASVACTAVTEEVANGDATTGEKTLRVAEKNEEGKSSSTF